LADGWTSEPESVITVWAAYWPNAVSVYYMTAVG